MSIVGAQFGSRLGTDAVLGAVARDAGLTTRSHAVLNIGTCFRFQATTIKDIKSARFRWGTCTTPGTVRITIETIDMTTGKPTGTLYDPNATIDITPTTGVQTYTFVTLPTTGLVVGNHYGIVFITTVAGTAQPLVVGAASATASLASNWPVCCLIASDGTLRSNFAENPPYVPTGSFVLEDDTEDTMSLSPFHTYAGVTASIYSTVAAALKFTLSRPQSIVGVFFDPVVRTGVPAGGLRLRLFDSNDNVVANSTVTIDKDLLTNVSNKRTLFQFSAPISTTAYFYIDKRNGIM